MTHVRTWLPALLAGLTLLAAPASAAVWPFDKKDKAADKAEASLPATLARAEVLARSARDKGEVVVFAPDGPVKKTLRAGADALAVVKLVKGERDDGYRRWKTRHDETSRRIAQWEREAFERRRAQARPPADVYHGQDREQLEAGIRDEWGRQYPDDRVVGVRFPQTGWFPGGPGTETMAASVVVQEGEVAAIHPVAMSRPSGSSSTPSLAFDRIDDPYRRSEMLASNLGYPLGAPPPTVTAAAPSPAPPDPFAGGGFPGAGGHGGAAAPPVGGGQGMPLLLLLGVGAAGAAIGAVLVSVAVVAYLRSRGKQA